MITRYTKESLGAAAMISSSVQDVARILIGKPVAGNQHQHIKRMIRKYGIDTSHFLGSGHNLGKTTNKRKLPEQIFIIGQRQKSHLLKRAMLELGVEYSCWSCGISNWKDTKLTLEIDHIDGNSADNSLANLRFLCPNCHSQTTTFGYRSKK